MSLSLIDHVITRRPRTPWYRTDTRVVVVPTPTPRFEITLDVTADSLLDAEENGTFGNLNADGKYYDIKFPDGTKGDYQTAIFEYERIYGNTDEDLVKVRDDSERVFGKEFRSKFLP